MADKKSDAQQTEQDTGELPSEVTDAIQVLKKHAGEHAEPIIAELKGTALYQMPYNIGHSVATRKFTDPDKGKLVAAEKRIGELEAEVAKASEGRPNLDNVKAGYIRQLEAKDAEIVKREVAIAALEGESVSDKLQAALGGRLRGAAAKLAAIELKTRIKRKDGRYVLVADDNPDVEVQVPKGKTVFDYVAEEAIKAADPEDVLSGATSGAGRTGGGSHPGVRPVKIEEIQAQKRAAGVGPAI